MTLPALLITIDTEGDDLWARPRTITTENARYLPRFQALCERFGFRPTYLTNYEMAIAPLYQQFARDVQKRNTAEIGMHLHAWNSPPLVPLTADDHHYEPYLIEYPDDVMAEKVAVMTRLLEDTFQTKMRSHRAGRWGFNEKYARLLVEHGYDVDCSVTPHISWHTSLGDPSRAGGPDYRGFPEHAYFLSLDDIRVAGDSKLLELPLSVGRPRQWPIVSQLRDRNLLRGRAGYYFERVFPEHIGFFPGKRNLNRMLKLLDEAERSGRGYAELALHSSELMPAGSPAFPDQPAIEALYRTLERIFTAASGRFRGATLAEFRDQYTAN